MNFIKLTSFSSQISSTSFLLILSLNIGLYTPACFKGISSQKMGILLCFSANSQTLLSQIKFSSNWLFPSLSTK